MGDDREYAAAIMWEGDDHIWWITGGYNYYNYHLRSTESFDVLDDGFSRDILLPKEMHNHNLINVNATHTVLLGGNDESDE